MRINARNLLSSTDCFSLDGIARKGRRGNFSKNWHPFSIYLFIYWKKEKRVRKEQKKVDWTFKFPIDLCSEFLFIYFLRRPPNLVGFSFPFFHRPLPIPRPFDSLPRPQCPWHWRSTRRKPFSYPDSRTFPERSGGDVYAPPFSSLRRCFPVFELRRST